MATNTAPVKWAQRSDSIYLTIALPDVTGEDLKLSQDKLHFKGTSNGLEYALELEFLHEVNAEKSTWKVLPRSIQMHIAKKDEDADFWARLLKDKTLEKTNVTVDWDKYVDEDDEGEEGGFDMSALDGGAQFGGMGGMGGMPGMGGMGGLGGMGGMQGLGGMGGMGGLGGMGGMGEGLDDEPDSDDDDDDGLPDLEDDVPAPVPAKAAPEGEEGEGEGKAPVGTD